MIKSTNINCCLGFSKTLLNQLFDTCGLYQRCYEDNILMKSVKCESSIWTNPLLAATHIPIIANINNISSVRRYIKTADRIIVPNMVHRSFTN
jgi:hypothetical protein